MDATKITTLLILGIVGIGLSLTLMQLIIRKQRQYAEKEGRLTLAYGISVLSWIVAITLLNEQVIGVAGEYLDVTATGKSGVLTTTNLTTLLLFLGVANLWMLLCYGASSLFSLFVTNNRTLYKEVDSDHYSYFVITGGIYVGTLYALMPVLELLLQAFIPTISVPFYR